MKKMGVRGCRKTARDTGVWKLIPKGARVSRASGEHTLYSTSVKPGSSIQGQEYGRIPRWRLPSCEMWRSVFRDVWKKFTASIFHPEDAGSKMLHNTRKFLPDYIATFPKRRYFILTADGTSNLAYYKNAWEKKVREYLERRARK